MLSLLLSTILGCGAVAGKELVIHNAHEFNEFSVNMSNNMNYKGTTVLLDADIDYVGKVFESVKRGYAGFRGTFDGQGHTISNLAINVSSSNDGGLFMYSDGTTIKNVVLDGSCSITGALKPETSIFIGGIIGYCRASDDPCNIENNVNMANIRVSGDGLGYYIGGIGGYAFSSVYDLVFKNCANYGTITFSGRTNYSYIGGIVGHYGGKNHYEDTHIYNCLNQGAIVSNEASSDFLAIGGIVGEARMVSVEDCVSAGTITTTDSVFAESYIGGIVGTIEVSAALTHCYWSEHEACGNSTFSIISESTTFDDDFKLMDNISIGTFTGTSLIEVLNTATDYYTLRQYAHWLLNRNKNDVKLKVNGYNSFKVSSKVILLPRPSNTRKLWFDGWYTDSECTVPLSSYEIGANAELYGRQAEKTDRYTITFDSRGGASVEPITEKYGTEVLLPSDVVRESGCMIFAWKTEYGDRMPWNFVIPAHDVTLYAVWQCMHIGSVDEFLEFSENVNNGTNYKGITVILDTDLDFVGKTVDPVGKDFVNIFSGTFDGQGHTISNLVISSSSLVSIGLFGHLEGNLRYIVIDETCSFTSTYESDNKAYVYVGSVAGSCLSCTIDNCVNRGTVNFNGNIYSPNDKDNELFIGGIIGSISNDCTVKKCINYGNVTHTGKSYDVSMGGIVGDSGAFTSDVFVLNCTNYGEVALRGSIDSDYRIGGIIGRKSSGTIVEDCKNYGSVSSASSIIVNIALLFFLLAILF